MKTMNLLHFIFRFSYNLVLGMCVMRFLNYELFYKCGAIGRIDDRLISLSYRFYVN